MTAATQESATARPKSDDDLDHLYCCDRDVSLCGLDISDAPEAYDDDEPLCVVCDEVDRSGAACDGCRDQRWYVLGGAVAS